MSCCPICNNACRSISVFESSGTGWLNSTTEIENMIALAQSFDLNSLPWGQTLSIENGVYSYDSCSAPPGFIVPAASVAGSVSLVSGGFLYQLSVQIVHLQFSGLSGVAFQREDDSDGSTIHTSCAAYPTTPSCPTLIMDVTPNWMEYIGTPPNISPITYSGFNVQIQLESGSC